MRLRLTLLLSLLLASLILPLHDSYAQEIEGVPGAKVSDPTNTGAAGMSIPIEVPPGRNGIAPNLAIYYSSSKSNGMLGVGWDLSMGEIQRSTTFGVNYGSNNYTFSGSGSSSDLVPRGDWGTNYYGAKIEGQFSKFYYNSSTGGWETTTKDGNKYYYGSTAASRQDNIYGTFKWCLDKVQDGNGNYMTVAYTKSFGEIYPDRIDYTGNGSLSPANHVLFSYESRNDVPSMFTTNSRVITAYRLKTIETYGNGQLAKRYVLSYTYSPNTSRSLLSSVTVYGSDGVSTLPAITFGWQSGSNVFAPYSKWAMNGADIWNRYQVGDFNGDGKTDVISFETNGGLYVWPSNGSNGFTGPSLWAMNGADIGPTRYQLGDFNGDGKTDVISFEANGGLYVWLSTGNNGFSSPTPWGSNGLIDPTRYKLGDFNGDGKTDVISFESSGGFYVWTSNGGGFDHSPTPWGSNGADIGSARYKLGDFNGDGKTDVVSFEDNGTSCGFYVWTANANGNGFDHSASPWGTNGSGLSPDRYQLADVNGDGKTDVISFEADGSFHVWLSTGAGFSYEGRWGANGADIGTGRYRLVDLNGDGKADILSFEANGNIYAWLSTGNSFVYAGQYGSNGTIDPLRYQVGDFNGDGKNDIVSFEASGGIYVWPANPLFSDLLSTVGNGIGGTTTISYTPSSAYTNTNLPFIVQTVSSIAVNDGSAPGGGNISTTNYTYSGGLYDPLDREFRGFSYEKTIAPSGAITETWFHQDDIYKGLPSSQVAWGSDGLIYTEAINFYTYTAPYSGVKFPYMYQKDDYLCDGASSNKDNTAPCKRVAATFSYDGYGNVTRKYSYGDVNVPGDERDEYTEYIYDTANWRVALPSHTYVLDSTGVKKAEAWVTYYANGNLHTKTSWLNGGSNPVVSYGYNAYGNQTSITDPKGNITTIDYDATYTYPVKTTSPAPFNFVSQAVYDLRYGKPLSKTDANGSTVTYNYDAFGRLLNSSDQHNGDPAYAWKETYYDGLGRTTKEKKGGPDGKVIASETVYNNKGQVYRTSLPYFEGIENPRWTYYTYDPIGRVKQVDNPDNTNVRKSYMQGRTTLVDANGHVKVEEKDVYGRLVKVEEYTGIYPSQALYATTTYRYDVLGNLLNVTDAQSHQTNITYDTLSRKTAMDDPDMGHWSYQYDPNGNFFTQTDAKNQTITFTYDALNRITRKHYPTGTDVVYTYDEITSTNAKGRLTTVTDASGMEQFSYDVLGRATVTTKTVDGVPYTTEATYDGLGRTSSIRYPDNEIISYSYDGGGNLAGVSGYVTYANFNALGQAGTITYANGVSTTQQYRVDNNRLYSITTNSPVSGLQNMSYNYDNAGNVSTITDIMDGSRTQSFQYDHLHRLTQAVSVAYGTLTWNYDQIGNMTYNSQLGAYTYGDSTHVHAVTQAGANSYGYDANGNMINRKGVTITYDYDNRPASVGANTFVYDHSGTRTKKTTANGTDVYIGKLYRCNGGSCTKYIFAGSNRVAAKTAADTLYYHTDHLGSSNIITDKNGNKVEEIYYYPYGGTRLNTGTYNAKHKFTGQEEDGETGLYYYGARYYDPELGRFISADSIVPNPRDPQNLNRYSYCVNNPLIYIDPSGHFSFKKFFKSVTKVFKKFTDTIISAGVGFVVGGPIGGIAAAGANIFLSHTGEGRKLVRATGRYIFDNMLGLPPDIAYMASNITLTAAMTWGITEGYNLAAGKPSFSLEDVSKLELEQQQKVADMLSVEPAGGLGSGGGNVATTAGQPGGRLMAALNSEGNVIGVYADAPAFGTGNFGAAIGLRHTAAIMKTSTGYATSLTGFTRANLYANTVVCHQMTNQTFLQAGFSNTVAGISGSGTFTHISSVFYGQYGSPLPAQVYFADEDREK